MEIHIDICEFCEAGELKFVEADPPWTAEHYICPICDSTYGVETEIVFESDFL
jgi:hypothetical protein